MRTDDESGQEYYDVAEALRVVGVSRGTFDKLVSQAHITPWKTRGDRKHYYRKEDIEGLKSRPQRFYPLEGMRIEQAAQVPAA